MFACGSPRYSFEGNPPERMSTRVGFVSLVVGHCLLASKHVVKLSSADIGRDDDSLLFKWLYLGLQPGCTTICAISTVSMTGCQW